MGDLALLTRSRAGRALVGAVSALALLTVVGLVLLWPGAEPRRANAGAFGGPTVPGRVTGSAIVRCPGPTPQDCRRLRVRVRGRAADLTLGPATLTPDVRPGEDVRVSPVVAPPGSPPLSAQAEPYSFVDTDRHGSVLLMTGILALFAGLVLWWRGLLAVVGVGLSLLAVGGFMVPAILAGKPALLVAFVGALTVMFTTVVLTSGVGVQTLTAVLGIATTLALACGLAVAAVHLAHLDGRTDELSIVLAQQNSRLSLRGVVLAGMLVGALGVLADTAVTQASAVMALRRANPRLTARGLFRGAFAVGRDHLSATIHTLVLAYVGATLPLLLVLRSAGVGRVDGLNLQDIAQPIVAAVVGCLALIAAVPLTTALASRFAVQLPAESIPADSHGHAH